MWTSNPTWGKLRIRAELAKIGIDFFVVPTVTFRVLYVFLVMSHDRRRILHFNVTTSPSARWTAQQVVEAFPYASSPRFLLRDRDKIFGSTFVRRVESMGIEEVVTAPGSTTGTAASLRPDVLILTPTPFSSPGVSAKPFAKKIFLDFRRCPSALYRLLPTPEVAPCALPQGRGARTRRASRNAHNVCRALTSIGDETHATHRRKTGHPEPIHA
jgi:hypothetical protein